MTRLVKACLASVLAACVTTPLVFGQQGYPNKPIKIVAPVQPGGGVDLVARQVGERLTKAFGQPVVVENQSGGGGIVGSQVTARAAPDGYTLMVGYVGTHGTNPAVRKLPYDAIKDFTPIAMVGGHPTFWSFLRRSRRRHCKKFITYAKANKGKLSYGSSGQGTLTHLAMEQLKVETDLDMQHVAYRGIGPAITDILVARHRRYSRASQPHCPTSKPARCGLLRSRERSATHCYPTYRLSMSWVTRASMASNGMESSVPPTCRRPSLTTLNTEINKMLADAAFAERLSAEALQPMPMTPQQFGQYIRDDIAKWTKVAKERNIELTE
jgi:tripartite-type tricarboxylate transporter receptor subunit TctC